MTDVSGSFENTDIRQRLVVCNDLGLWSSKWHRLKLRRMPTQDKLADAGV